jgi:hypothetical protein
MLKNGKVRKGKKRKKEKENRTKVPVEDKDIPALS